MLLQIACGKEEPKFFDQAEQGRERVRKRERERERDGGRGSFGTKILAMLAMSSQPQTLGVSVPGASASIFLTV